MAPTVAKQYNEHAYVAYSVHRVMPNRLCLKQVTNNVAIFPTALPVYYFSLYLLPRKSCGLQMDRDIVDKARWVHCHPTRMPDPD